MGECVTTAIVAAVYDRRFLFFNRFGALFLPQGRLRAPLQHKSRSCHTDPTEEQRWLMRQMNLVDRQIERKTYLLLRMERDLPRPEAQETLPGTAETPPEP